jgi:signal transduction histidine kinase
LKEIDLYGKPLYFIDNGLRIGKVSAEARRNANISFTTLFRGLHLFLVTTDLTRIGFRLIRPFSPEAYRNWQLFGNFEDALGGMLRTHFMPSSGLQISPVVESASAPETVSTPAPTDFSPSYHEHRIDELYTILAKIAYNEFDTIPTPVLPENDMYADIFKALSIVMEDKRLQMEQVLAQKGQLEEQSAQIQLVNTELSLQNVSLAALNREKSEIMGIVAHDLKNPIGAIRGLAELIESDFSDIDIVKISEIAAQIVRTSNRMLDLVKNILDINKLEEGAMRFQLVTIDLAPLIESAVWQYTQAAELKKITIHCEIEQGEKNGHGGSSTLAVADEQAIMQVFDNLLSNAVKYSPHGKNVFVRLKTSGRAVRFEVKDEGEGISSDDMPKLFGKFARLSAQPTGNEHSTGLGLSIVKKMVEAMGGNVWCESEFKQGATFIVELPMSASIVSTIIEA